MAAPPRPVDFDPADATSDQGPGVPSRPGLLATRISLGRVFRTESANYFMLLGVTLFMVIFGLVMVLSSSSVDSGTDDNGNFFSKFWSQGMYAVVGIPLMLIVSRIPARFWRKLAWPLLIGTSILQVLVVATPLGIEINQNRNWLKIGPIVFQPSEGIKIAMILWIASFLAIKWKKITQWRYALLPVLLVSGFVMGLVMLGGDLGTVAIMASIVIGALFFAGVPIRQLAVTIVVAAGLAGFLAILSPSRVARLTDFLHPHLSDPQGLGYQFQQGTFALASGGVFGVGLGNSRSKWNWLPAADTDFIFAIIGEELGLIGAIVVLALFVLLALTFIRIIHASTDPFARVTTAAVMVWLIVQGLVNVAVVLGLMPVLGVPLPLISAGGTALLSSLLAIGIVLSFARQPTRQSTPQRTLE